MLRIPFDRQQGDVVKRVGVETISDEPVRLELKNELKP